MRCLSYDVVLSLCSKVPPSHRLVTVRTLYVWKDNTDGRAFIEWVYSFLLSECACRSHILDPWAGQQWSCPQTASVPISPWTCSQIRNGLQLTTVLELFSCTNKNRLPLLVSDSCCYDIFPCRQKLTKRACAWKRTIYKIRYHNTTIVPYYPWGLSSFGMSQSVRLHLGQTFGLTGRRIYHACWQRSHVCCDIEYGDNSVVLGCLLIRISIHYW